MVWVSLQVVEKKVCVLILLSNNYYMRDSSRATGDLQEGSPDGLVAGGLRMRKLQKKSSTAS